MDQWSLEHQSIDAHDDEIPRCFSSSAQIPIHPVSSVRPGGCRASTLPSQRQSNPRTYDPLPTSHLQSTSEALLSTESPVNSIYWDKSEHLVYRG